MYHFNDKFYFWLLKPVTRGYKAVVPEDFRGLFSNFYRNLKAPIRIVNNFFRVSLAMREKNWYALSSTRPSASEGSGTARVSALA